MSETVISARGLRMRYGSEEVVQGIDLDVRSGEVFAFLGPNGAGKTTTTEILEGYRIRSAGEVTVLGEDPGRIARGGAGSRRWRERIGIVLQQCDLEPFLTVRETLEMYAGYYSDPRPVEEVIELVGLAAKERDRAGSLSGGQQRRLDVGIALIGNPELIFLDEPTTGFDPTARRQAWKMIAGLRDLGKTVFLTTHYMDEAQELADRVMIIQSGKAVALGTPRELAATVSEPTRITFALPDGVGSPPDLDSLDGCLSSEVSDPGRVVTIGTESPARTLHALTEWALRARVDLADLEVRRPSLEDTYLQLTSLGDGEDAATGGEAAEERPVA